MTMLEDRLQQAMTDLDRGLAPTSPPVSTIVHHGTRQRRATLVRAGLATTLATVAMVSVTVAVLVGRSDILPPGAAATTTEPTMVTLTTTLASAATSTTVPPATTTTLAATFETYPTGTPTTVPEPPVAMYEIAEGLAIGWWQIDEQVFLCWQTADASQCVEERPQELEIAVGSTSTLYVLVGTADGGRPAATVTVVWEESDPTSAPVVWDGQVALGVARFDWNENWVDIVVDPPLIPPPSW